MTFHLSVKMQRTPPQIDRSLETEFSDEMPTTRDSLVSLVTSVLQQRETVMIEQMTSTVQGQMERSLEEFQIQFRISEVPTVFNTPATSANPQSSILPNQPVFLAPTTSKPFLATEDILLYL
jgi:hypothetical protein